MTWAFLLTSLAVVATPGTGAVLTIAAGLRRGRRAAVVTAAGCTLGIVPHLVAAVTGTAALLRAGGVAFEVMRVAGIVYLLVMAVLAWRDRGLLAVEADDRPRSAARTVLTAVLANLLNPKLTLFFFAFLPQFVDPARADALPHMLALSGVFMAMTFVVFSGYGLFSSAMRRRVVERPAVVRRLQRTFSLAYVGLAARLATTDR
ncbi:LysE family translocator [Phycicoccus flavus]|uniref:LysE family translocator n=1 Tax=Phycicoccus flavus TaxID=2502783 RepID=UPI000FEC0A25|nr:LysE family translocator [Phycicoccus flavus]NHA70296.1 LysE family translocator [Phycicoccus flavus]